MIKERYKNQRNTGELKMSYSWLHGIRVQQQRAKMVAEHL